MDSVPPVSYIHHEFTMSKKSAKHVLSVASTAGRMLTSSLAAMFGMCNVQFIAVSVSPVQTLSTRYPREEFLSVHCGGRSQVAFLLAMADSSLEHLFGACTLSLSTPENAYVLPTTLPGPSLWLQTALAESLDRKLAYFDEVLSAFLVLRIPYDPSSTVDDDQGEITAASTTSNTNEDGRPPTDIVTLLTFLQVGFDASYIAPRQESQAISPGGAGPMTPGPEQTKTGSAFLGPPPPGRPGAKPRPGSSPLKPRPPPLIPPQTPNPTPQMEDSERQYAGAEGIQLHSFIWGDAPGSSMRKDEFCILWDEKSKEWVVIYRMDVTIGGCALFDCAMDDF